MKIIIHIFFLTFSCLNSIHLNGQENLIKKDLENVHIHYSNIVNYSMNFEIQYVDNNSKIFFKQKGKVVHSKSIHYTDVAGNITLIKENEFISINTNNKIIYYNKNKSKTQKQSNNIDVSALIDSLYNKNDLYKYTYLSSKKGQKRIFIESKKDKIYDAFEIVIDSKSNTLLEYKYFIKANSQGNLSEIRIVYSNENSRPNLKLPFLKLKYYVAGGDKQKKVSDNFSGYRLIDQTKI